MRTNRFRIVPVLLLCIITACNNIECTYYNNGNLKSEIPKSFFGKYNGKARFYDKNGIIEKEILYNMGTIDTFKVYYDSGQLHWESPYKENKKNGLYIEYFKNRNIKKKIYYHLGKLNHYYEFDTTNKLIFEYRQIRKEDLPPFSTNYITTSFVVKDSINTVTLRVPTIPPSQLSLIIDNGIVRVKDRIEGIWEVETQSNDSIILGMQIFKNDSTNFIYGTKKLKVVK